MEEKLEDEVRGGILIKSSYPKAVRKRDTWNRSMIDIGVSSESKNCISNACLSTISDF